MTHIVVIGAGLGGLPTAYELRHLLPHHHRIILISDTPQFTFLPLLPWVALGLTTLESIQVKLINRLEPRGIRWIQGRVEGIDPDSCQLVVNQEQLSSVCNPHHAH